ncbi:MAG: hypothetical protein JST00_07135 [Deltaproteobacteria bacterium]|nr:hypothetical protein [Deltaproteobacteria bacterium]
MRLRAAVVASSLVCLIGAAGCATETEQAPPPLESGQRASTTGGGARLHPGASFLPSEVSDAAEVFDDRIVFPSRFCSVLTSKKDEIILGDAKRFPNANDPNVGGFLRRVLKVDCGDKVTVHTGPATLPEAFDDLDLDRDFTLPKCEKTTKGIGIESDRVLFDEDFTATTASGRTLPVNASAKLQASLCFTPKLKVKADLGFMKVKSFEVSATGELAAGLSLTAATKVTVALDAKTAAEIASKPLRKSISIDLAKNDIPITSLDLGPVRLPVSARTSAVLSCDLAFTAPAEIKAGVSASASLTAGVSYKDGTLSPIWSEGAKLTTTPPTFTKDGLVHAVCTVVPKIELRLFGLAAAELTTRARLGLGAAQTCDGKNAQGAFQRTTTGDIDSAIVVSVLAKVDVLGKHWKKECTLLSAAASAHYERSFSSPDDAQGTCTAIAPLPVPPIPAADPRSCFDSKTPPPAAPPPGGCSHDVCSSGERLGPSCDACTAKVCAVDPYCCDTYWGSSCFAAVERECGRSCSTP